MKIGVNRPFRPGSQHDEFHIVSGHGIPVDIALPSGYVDSSCYDAVDHGSIQHLIIPVYPFIARGISGRGGVQECS